MSCEVCARPSEVHHIYSRKSHPEFIDCEWNHFNLCRQHHTEIHQIGRSTFIKKYRLHRYMTLKGWVLDEILNKWFYPNIHESAEKVQ